jgi:hypothetical protein
MRWVIFPEMALHKDSYQINMLNQSIGSRLLNTSWILMFEDRDPMRSQHNKYWLWPLESCIPKRTNVKLMVVVCPSKELYNPNLLSLFVIVANFVFHYQLWLSTLGLHLYTCIVR